jgi:hypothetical protein
MAELYGDLELMPFGAHHILSSSVHICSTQYQVPNYQFIAMLDIMSQ